MSSFTTPADVRILDSYKFQLLADFAFYTLSKNTVVIAGEWRGAIVLVPAGFITDLASVPRALWSVFPPHGKYAKAAILHDYLYEHAINTKRYADNIFLEAMEVLGVPKWRRLAMYWAVRLFGRGNYGKK